MGDTTDELMAMAHGITPAPNPRELDLLLTAGERIAMSLLAIAINDAGVPAASYTGSQAGIITDTSHGQAKIIDIRPGRIEEALGRGNVVIVAGFQGVSDRPGRDHARPRRIRHDRGGAGRRAGSRRLRDLHRRRRRATRPIPAW